MKILLPSMLTDSSSDLFGSDDISISAAQWMTTSTPFITLISWRSLRISAVVICISFKILCSKKANKITNFRNYCFDQIYFILSNT